VEDRRAVALPLLFVRIALSNFSVNSASSSAPELADGPEIQATVASASNIKTLQRKTPR
jgi:hypothetical protein